MIEQTLKNTQHWSCTRCWLGSLYLNEWLPHKLLIMWFDVGSLVGPGQGKWKNKMLNTTQLALNCRYVFNSHYMAVSCRAPGLFTVCLIAFIDCSLPRKNAQDLFLRPQAAKTLRGMFQFPSGNLNADNKNGSTPDFLIDLSGRGRIACEWCRAGFRKNPYSHSMRAGPIWQTWATASQGLRL